MTTTTTQHMVAHSGCVWQVWGLAPCRHNSWGSYWVLATNSVADVAYVSPGLWEVTRINAGRVRGAGCGSALLGRIMDDADKGKVTLRLAPVPSAPPGQGLGKRQLIAWYRRHGFAWAGKPGASYMVREPQ